MRRSKLEICFCILETLARHGPLKITHVMQKANVNCNILNIRLDFLIKQGAVEEKFVGKDRIVYAITPRGMSLLRFFVNLQPMISELENEH
jgi:predicted transcriptional regulator